MEAPSRRLLICAPLLMALVTLTACRMARPAESPGEPAARSSLSPANELLDLDEEELKVVWRQELGQSTRAPISHIWSAGDWVVVEAGEGQLHLYDDTTGQWKTGEALLRSIDRRPVAWGDRLILAGGNKILSFEIATGRADTVYSPEFAVFTAPLIFRGDLLLAGGDGTLVRARLNADAPEWARTLQGPILEQPVLMNGTLFASAHADVVAALDAENGQEQWSWKPPWPAKISSGVAVADGRLYAGDNLGRLYMLQANTGQVRWRKTLSASVVSRPVVAGGRLLVFTNKPRVVCLDAESGESGTLWTYEDAVELIAVGKGRLYLLNADNSVAAVSLEDGAELWRDPLPADCMVAGDEARAAFYIANSKGSIVAVQELEMP